jgi:hypothetical protein
VVTLSVLALAFGAAYYWLCSADRRLQSARKLREPTPEALAQLGQIESHDVSTFLKDLGDRADDPPRNPPG